MNAFLFSDKSFHKLFLKGVEYNFAQQILQIILSVIITHIVEILLCFLSMTDRIIYQIKKIAKTGKENKIIFNCLKKIRIKLIIFFVGTFIVILFYWYFISAFCSVYKNTQKTHNSHVTFFIRLKIGRIRESTQKVNKRVYFYC